MYNKQYSFLEQGGMFFPSMSLVGFVPQLEVRIREHVVVAMYTEKIRSKFVTKLLKHQLDVSRGNANGETANLYMTQLYFIVRIHHMLCEQNRRF